jgi:hypothetical protein
MNTETKELPETSDVIKDMLTENTGRHLLDSGGAYGRNWERNKERSFEEEPVSEQEIWGNEDGSFDVNVTLNIYHFLNAFLEYNEQAYEINQQFHKYADNQNEHWLKLMKEWTDGNAVNTYNQETILGQTLQYVPFRMDEGEPEYHTDPYSMEYILLQIHNGCDVRGGYTAPVVFKMLAPDYWYTSMTDVYATADTGPCGWYSDDTGYHFYTNNQDVHDFKHTEYDPSLDVVYCNKCVQDAEIEHRKMGKDFSIEELKETYSIDFYATVDY